MHPLPHLDSLDAFTVGIPRQQDTGLLSGGPPPPTALPLDIMLTTPSEPSRPVTSNAVNYFHHRLPRELRILFVAAFTNLREAEHRRASTSGKSAVLATGQTRNRSARRRVYGS